MKLKDLLKRPEVVPTEIEGLYFRERTFGELMEFCREEGVDSEADLDEVGKAHMNLSAYACDEKGQAHKGVRHARVVAGTGGRERASASAAHRRRA